MNKTVTLLILVFFVSIAYGQTERHSEDSCTKDTDAELFEIHLRENMDKMLDLWYVKRELNNSGSVLSRLHDDPNATEESDSLIVARLSQIQTSIPLAYNPKVKRMIEAYVDRRKRSSAAMLGLARYYFPWMQEIFDKYGLPEELVYMTIIESALNPTAVSRAGATGIWQFMYGTGKMYGLEVNTFIDDRRDPYKATDAAARYLRDLHNIFQDWGLAIAAYNCGPGNVRKAITRAGGGKQDFWSISNYLPRETQNYFPGFIGAMYMVKYHALYGITPAKITIPTNIDSVMVKKELHLEQVSRTLSIDLDEIKTLNPQYKREVIPAYTSTYPLRLQAPDIIRYLENKDSIHAYYYDTFFIPIKVYENMFTGKTDPNTTTQKIYHTVKKGEVLGKVASKYGLSVYELKKMNKLSSNSIKVGQRLVVGYKSVSVANSSSASTTSSPKTTTTSASSPKPVTAAVTPAYYIVKKGDTFNGIAQKLRVSPKSLADFNGIKNTNVLSIGQKLKIPPK